MTAETIVGPETHLSHIYPHVALTGQRGKGQLRFTKGILTLLNVYTYVPR